MRKTEYHARIELRVPDRVSSEDLDAAYDTLLESRTLIAPVMSDNLSDRTVALTYNVVSESPQAALEAALAELCSALRCRGRLHDAPLVSMEASPYVDPKLLEMVSQAEIARRLGVSREWVRRLAGRGDFPRPAQAGGSRSGLFRWGEILAWRRQQEAGMHRTKRQTGDRNGKRVPV